MNSNTAFVAFVGIIAFCVVVSQGIVTFSTPNSCDQQKSTIQLKEDRG